MRANAGLLAVRANRNQHAAFRQPVRLAGVVIVHEIGVGRLRPSHAFGKLRRRNVALKDRLGKHVGCLPPIGIARQPAIADHKRWRISRFGCREKAQHILVKHAERNVMLKRRIAIGNQIHVHAKQRTPFGHHLHILAARCLHHLLPLFPARLVVILHAVGALRLQPAHMRQRIVQ